ncbi:MAG: S-layer homology domain-containing protein [Thermoleophilia bacterium]
MDGRRPDAHHSEAEVTVRGRRTLAALAAVFPLFYFSPWVELTAVDQPSNVQAGTTFTSTVEAVAHLGDGPWFPVPEVPGLDGDVAPTMPPIDEPPLPTGTVSLRLGVLVPDGWRIASVEYTVTTSLPLPAGSELKGSLTAAPGDTWVYDVHRPAPVGYQWRAFGGAEVETTRNASVRFTARVTTDAREGRYPVVYGTWSQPPDWYPDTGWSSGGGTPPPADSLIPMPPPTFVSADIIVGDVGPAPRVVSFVPGDGAADVAVDSDLRVTFDRDMDLSTLREGGIQLYSGPVFYATGGATGVEDGPAWRPQTALDPFFTIPPWEPWPIPVQIFWNATTKTAVVDPLQDLAGHTVHTVLVTDQARAIDGAPVDTARAVSFLTERLPAPPFFSDVPAGYRFRRAIEVLFDAGVLTGFPDGTFRPDNSVTRGQLATMLVRLLGLHTPEPDAQPPFRDLPAPADDVGADYVAEAAKAGIAAGFEDGAFRPHDLVTRIQMTRMIVRAAQAHMAAPPPDYSAGFKDVDQVDQGFVNWAAFNDLADGTAPGRFDPWSTATRGHAARLLYGVWNAVPRPYPLSGSSPTENGSDSVAPLGP